MYAEHPQLSQNLVPEAPVDPTLIDDLDRVAIEVKGAKFADLPPADRAEIISGLGAFLVERGRLQAATSLLAKADEEGLTSPDLLHNLGVAYLEASQSLSAGTVLVRAVELDGSRAATYHSLGNALKNLALGEAGRRRMFLLGQAVRCYERALTINSGYTFAEYGWAKVLTVARRLDEAKAMAERGLAHSTDATMRGRFGEVLEAISIAETSRAAPEPMDASPLALPAIAAELLSISACGGAKRYAWQNGEGKRLYDDVCALVWPALARNAGSLEFYRDQLSELIKIVEFEPGIEEPAYFHLLGEVARRLDQDTLCRESYRRALECDAKYNTLGPLRGDALRELGLRDLLRGMKEDDRAQIEAALEFLDGAHALGCVPAGLLAKMGEVREVWEIGIPESGSAPNLAVSGAPTGAGSADASEPESHHNSRCFIATAACGSASAWEVVTLRRFRDARLKISRAGRCAIALYETVSPPVAVLVSRSPRLARLVRRLVVGPLATILQGSRHD